MKGSGMPQIRAALGGWTRRMTLVKICQDVENGLVIDVEKPFTFRGTIQPLSPREINLKPEGQRSWEWLQIHCLTNDASVLKPNDRVYINKQLYKIMGQNDYSLNGYIEYHAIKDYQDAPK